MASAPVVLITGASAGIGEALARRFARDGYTLVVVARRRERLDALLETLGAQGHVIAEDLADSQAPARIKARTEELGLEVDVVVNNAGFGDTGDFVELGLERALSMIEVNCSALVALSHLYGKDMKARGRGAILNVASTAGFQPGPGMSVYFATKAFVVSFSEGLHEELKAHGVTVSALCPGATDTEFQGIAGNDETLLFAAGVMDAETVARAGYEGLKAKRALIVPGLKNKLGVFSVRLSPRAVVRKLTQRLNALS